MNIVVCIKQVPATTKIKIDSQTNTLVRDGIENVVNPYDTYALEEGIRLKERYGGRVTAISMGPPQAETILREAIAMGADDAILLSDRAFAGADTLATACTLATAISKEVEECGLVICGRQSIDGDTGQVGPQLAEILAFSFISYVYKVEDISPSSMRVCRMVEDGNEIIEALLPSVISVVKDINVPRLPSLRGIMRAKNTSIRIFNTVDLGIDADTVGLAGSATKVVKIFSPETTCRGEIMAGSLEDQVDTLITRLKSDGII